MHGFYLANEVWLADLQSRNSQERGSMHDDDRFKRKTSLIQILPIGELNLENRLRADCTRENNAIAQLGGIFN